MSFWDNYRDVGGASSGKYISSDEKQVLIDNGVVFEITALQEDRENKYGPRYVAFVTIPASDDDDPLDAKISFPLDSGVDSRDTMLRNMEQYLEKDDAEPVKVKLTKVGRAIAIVPGS